MHEINSFDKIKIHQFHTKRGRNIKDRQVNMQGGRWDDNLKLYLLRVFSADEHNVTQTL